MNIVILGLSITSSWGNGHATTYRSLCKALARRGHRIHFIEKDVEWYRSHRDLPSPEFCSMHLYADWRDSASSLLAICKEADVVVVGSYFPDAIAATVDLLSSGYGPIFFYDIDTPVTLAQLRQHGKTEYLDASLIPQYAAYLSFSGGPSLTVLEKDFGSPRAVGFYCSVDAEIYRPSAKQEMFQCDLSYLGTYAADRQAKLLCFLNRAAALTPTARFLVAGPQYPEDTPWAANVQHLDHVAPCMHAAFYSSSRFTLNLTRDDMVAAGFSPSVRLFEASACGSAILSDQWAGLSDFLSPGEEVLVPHDEYEVVSILKDMPEREAERIGRSARERILAYHSSDCRALEFEAIVAESCAPHRGRLIKRWPDFMGKEPRRTWDGYDAYLFDIDGTLLECKDAVHYFAFCHALEVLAGRPLTLEGVTAHGNTDVGILRDALRLASVPDAAWRGRLRETQLAMCRYVEEHKPDLRVSVLPQVVATLDYLREGGAILGVATGNLEGIGRLKLDCCGLLPYFGFSGYSDDYEYRSDVFAAALDKARCLAGNDACMCVVGDTPADVQAAHANGLDVIAVATGIYSVKQLAEASPEWCIPSLASLEAGSR